jgi:ribosomal protein S18 acetylase RimI-like enzyme
VISVEPFDVATENDSGPRRALWGEASSDSPVRSPRRHESGERRLGHGGDLSSGLLPCLPAFDPDQQLVLRGVDCNECGGRVARTSGRVLKIFAPSSAPSPPSTWPSTPNAQPGAFAVLLASGDNCERPARPASLRTVWTREAGETDAAAVTALWTEAYADAGPEGRRQPYALQEYFAVAAMAEVSVVEDGGEVVAVVVLFAPGSPGRSVAGPGEAELARLAVAPAARRQGIGRALVEHCAARARALGAEAVALWSRPYQADAHRLYESLGYRRVPERDGEDRDGRRWVFRLDLGASG